MITEHKFKTLVKMYKNNDITLSELIDQGFHQEYVFGNVAVESSYDYNFFKRLVNDGIVTLKDCLKISEEEKILSLLKDSNLVKAASVEDIEALIVQFSKSNEAELKTLCTHDEVFDVLLSKKFKNSGKKFVDFLKEHALLVPFFEHGQFCKNFFSNLRNVRYALTQIDSIFTMQAAFKNLDFIRQALKNQLIDQSLIKKFNEFLETTQQGRALKIDGFVDVYELFDKIASQHPTALSVLKEALDTDSEMQIQDFIQETRSCMRALKNVHSLSFLNEQEKHNMLKKLNSNAIARNKLNDVVSNHLESQYESVSDLNAYLFKAEKNAILNI